VLAAGLLGTVAAATGACAKPAGSVDVQSLPSGEDLVFGASLELTGPGSVAGTAQERALRIARDILNANGVTIGNTVRKVQVNIRDNGSDPVAAAAIAQQFINAKVAGIVGGGLASTTIAMARIAEPHGIPLLSTTAADGVILPPASHRFIFKLGPNATDVAALLRTALDRESRDTPLTKIGLLAAANEHGDAGVEAVRAMLTATNRKLTGVERLPDGAQNYQVQADRIAAGTPDAVIIWAVSPVSGLAARALRAGKFSRKLLFDSGAASEESLSPDNREAMADSYVVGPQILGGNPVAVNTPNGVARRDFFDRYSRAHGTFSSLGVFAADALDLLASAASRAAATTPLRIRNELESVPFDGLAGAYVFSTADHGGMEPDALALFSLQRNGGWLQLA
jgi:branched-chain amino acid transport system substrate-binding protein